MVPTGEGMWPRAGGFEALMLIIATLLGGFFREILLPRTDAGVAAQVVLVAIVGVVAFVLARRNREIRTFVLGCVIFTYAFFGLRAVH
jgi:hypothetical protein